MARTTEPAFTFVDFAGPEREPDLYAAMEALWLAAWTRTMPAIDFSARRGWLKAHLAGALGLGATIRVVLAGDGRPAGFVMIDPASHYLDQIAVDPLYWGSGAARDLLAEARRLSPSLIRLDVNADNCRAVAFYERAGFSVIGSGVNERSGLKTLQLEWRPNRDAAGTGP
jgi:putative acetyltransferase